MKKWKGWGIVYQEIMSDRDISPEAKCIYAYLASLAGMKNVCYPSIDTLIYELGMSKNRIAKHMNQLLEKGIVERVREHNGNLYGRNIYRITHEEEILGEMGGFRPLENEDLENREVENKANNTKSLKTNSLNIKKDIISPIVTLYNQMCPSLPRVTKISDARKKAIQARLNQGYIIDDFRNLFELAESSSFLKGRNDRNWIATFDWLIKDRNMAKVLDNNYQDRKGINISGASDNKDRRPASDRYRGMLKDGDC